MPLSASAMELDGVRLDTITQRHDSLSLSTSEVTTTNPPTLLPPPATLVEAAQEPTTMPDPHNTALEPSHLMSSTPVLVIATKATSILLPPSIPDAIDADSPPPSPPAHAIFDLPASPALLCGSLPPGSPVSTEGLNGIPTPLPGPLSLGSHALAERLGGTRVSSVSTAAKTTQMLKKRKAGEDSVGSFENSGGKGGDGTNNNRQSKKAIRGKRNGILVPVLVPPQVPVASTTRTSSRARAVTTPAIPTTTLVQAPAQMGVPPASSPSTLIITKPAWFTAAVSMMEGEKGMGVVWAKLVDAWATFEGQAGYMGDKKLSTAHRPDAIKAWIARARSSSWRPAISDTSLYETEFTLWWAMLQPVWRKRSDGSIIFSKVEGDWEVLRRAGLNGVLSVMAGLLFWGVSLRDGGGSRVGWNKAVSDCLIVMKSITL